MRFGDEELGGKHIDPANIRMQGEQQECAKLIGYGRKMLGNLKHRMQLGELEMGKTSQSGTYKYIARLEELERWGRPVVAKRSILNLHDHPDTVDRTEYEVTVDWSIAANSVKSAVEGGDLDSLRISTNVGYNLVEEFPFEESPPPTEDTPISEEVPLSGRRVIGYIVQAFSSDPTNDDNPIDLLLTNPDGSQLQLLAVNVPRSTLEPAGYHGFPDNGAYYAPSNDKPELQLIFSTKVHMVGTYDLGGPEVVGPGPDAAGVENFTWVSSYTTDSGICGWHPVIGDLHWSTTSFWGVKYTERVQAAIKYPTPHWEDVTSVFVNSPGLIYSGPWYPDHIFGASCDRIETIPHGVSYDNTWIHKSHAIDVAVAAAWNNAYKVSFDSYTSKMKNSANDAYDYTYGPYRPGGPPVGVIVITRRADAHGFGMMTGFEMPNRNTVIIHDRTEMQYGSAAIFMMPDKSAKVSYTYCDTIHASVQKPTSNTFNVQVGAIMTGVYDSVAY